MFMFLFFFNDTATTEIYTLSLHDALPIWFYEHSGLDVWGTARALVTNVAAGSVRQGGSTLTQQLVKPTLAQTADTADRKSTRPELQSRQYLVCRLLLEKKKNTKSTITAQH